MDGKNFRRAYYDIIRNYLRDEAIFDDRYQAAYPKEYQQTQDTYAWVNHYLTDTVFPYMRENGGKPIVDGVQFEGYDFKLLDKFEKSDYEEVNEYFENNNISFWKDIPDIDECTKDMKEAFVNEPEIEVEEDSEFDL